MFDKGFLIGLGVDEAAAEEILGEHRKIIYENAMNEALTAAGARNHRAVRALLDVDADMLGEDGRIRGLDEKLKALKESEGYLFEERPVLRGLRPGQGRDELPEEGEGATYSEIMSR